MLRETGEPTPFDGLVVFGDADAGDANAVTAVSASSMLTARLTIRRRIRSALDLGTGAGVQALLAARHCDRVTAVDVNERALRFAQLNAEVNDAGSIRLLEGSWFDPLDPADRFDLIVANLPFVPAPEIRSVYRDAPGSARELVERCVAGCVDRLADGGLAHLTVAWTRTAAESPFAFPVGLLGGRQCDCVLFRIGSVDARAYAERQLQLPDEAADRAALIESYVDHYEREGIEVVETAHLVLRRRRAARNWFRAVRLYRMPDGPCGEQVDRIVEAQEWLDRAPDERVLQSAFSVPAHELVTEAGTTMIRSVPDIGFLGPLPGEARSFVDGIRRGEPVGDPELVPIVRDLVGLGFLEPR